MSPNEKFFKTLIYIFIALSLLIFLMIQPYNFYCHISKNCRPILLSSMIHHKKGQQELVFNFKSSVPENLKNLIEFYPQKTSENIINGKNIINSYYLKNLTNQEITIHAHYNLTPSKANKYLKRIECLCFQNQSLKPQEIVEMPVNFVIDADIEKDPEFKNITIIEVNYSPELVE